MGRALTRKTGGDESLRFRYESTPLGDHPLRMRSSEPGETHYFKEFGEAISFAHLAVGADIDGQVADTVSKAPPEPDLIVTFTDGSQKYVEVAQVLRSSSHGLQAQSHH